MTTIEKRRALIEFFNQVPSKELELDNTRVGRFDAALNTPEFNWDLQAAFLQPAGIFCFVTDPYGEQPDEQVIPWQEATSDAISRAFNAMQEGIAWVPSNEFRYPPITDHQ